LIENGAETNVNDQNQKNALHLLYIDINSIDSANFIKMNDYLVEQGVDINQADN